jgi:hypothetical protein
MVDNVSAAALREHLGNDALAEVEEAGQVDPGDMRVVHGGVLGERPGSLVGVIVREFATTA